MLFSPKIMESKIYYSSFPKCLEKIAKHNQKIGTTKDLMEKRMEEGLKSRVCYSSFWLPENYNIIDGKLFLSLQEYNPLILYSKEALNNSLRNIFDPFILNESIQLNGKSASQIIPEIAEEDASKRLYERRVLLCEEPETPRFISSKSLGENEEIIFLARGEKLAKEYGEFLFNCGIKQTAIYKPLQLINENFTKGFILNGLVGGKINSSFKGNSSFAQISDVFSELFFGVERIPARASMLGISE